MNRLLFFAVLLAPGLGFSQTPPVTPNTGLYLPPHGSYGWDNWYNLNWQNLDTRLGVIATNIASNTAGIAGNAATIAGLQPWIPFQTYDVNSSVSTCTYSAVTWNTKADCAYQAAVGWINNTQSAAVLHVDAQGPYSFNQQLIIPALVSTWQTLSVIGDNQESSILRLDTALASGKAMVSHATNAQLGRYRIANVRFTVNSNATAAMDLFGTNLSSIENVTVQGYTGDQTTFSHAVSLGDLSGGNAGSFQTNFIRNLQIIGSSSNPTSQAVLTANWSGSVLTFTLVSGGAGYNAATAYPVVRGYGFLDSTTSYPTPCTTMPSNYAVTVVAGAVTAVTPSNDYAGCSGTFFSVRVIALPKNGNYAVNYGLLCRACTDNSFTDVVTGSAAIWGARIEQGGNVFHHFHPITSIVGLQDYGQSKWFGTECDSNWDCGQLESASQVFATDFVFNQTAATGWYDNASGFFLNSSLTPGVNGATLNGSAMFHQPTTYFPFEAPAGPTTSGIPGGVNISNMQTASTFFGEDVTMNSTALAKNVNTAFNSQKTTYQYDYNNNGSQAEKWTCGTNGPTTISGGAPSFENFDCTAPSTFQSTFDYTYRYAYTSLPATSGANHNSPYVANLATYWDGSVSQAVYCGNRIEPGAGTNPTTVANSFCQRTGATSLNINWRFTGKFLSISAPGGGQTTSFDFSNPTSSRTLLWPDNATPFIASGNFLTTAATSDVFTVTGVTASSICTFAPTNPAAAAATGAYISNVATNAVTLQHAVTASLSYSIQCSIQ